MTRVPLSVGIMKQETPVIAHSNIETTVGAARCDEAAMPAQDHSTLS